MYRWFTAETVITHRGRTMAKEEAKKTEKAKKPPEKEKPAKEAKGENVVLIGRKPVMNYVVACITFFNTGEKKVTVKARGRAISRAVDTVELLRRAFVKDLEVADIAVGTEEIQRQEGGTRNISTMEITVAKAGSK
jgi:DNA-binding protein